MLKGFRKHTKLIIWLVVLAFAGWGGFSVGTSFQNEGRYAGKVFGKPVHFQEFNEFYRSTQIFSGTEEPITDPEFIRIKTWQNIILSREAKSLNIKVKDNEVRDEITRLLAQQKIENPSMEFYERWLRSSLNVTPVEFEGQIREILRIQKLVKQVTDGVTTEPTDEQMKARFLREQQSLSLEMIHFTTEEEAKTFYDEIMDSKDWEKAKEKYEGQTMSTGKVAMDAIVTLWRIPEDQANEIFEMDIDAITKPTPVGERFAVIKLLDKVYADEESYDKDQYREKLLNKQISAFLRGWSEDLQERAALEDFLPQREATDPPAPPAPPAPEEAPETPPPAAS